MFGIAVNQAYDRAAILRRAVRGKDMAVKIKPVPRAFGGEIIQSAPHMLNELTLSLHMSSIDIQAIT